MFNLKYHILNCLLLFSWTKNLFKLNTQMTFNKAQFTKCQIHYFFSTIICGICLICKTTIVSYEWVLILLECALWIPCPLKIKCPFSNVDIPSGLVLTCGHMIICLNPYHVKDVLPLSSTCYEFGNYVSTSCVLDEALAFQNDVFFGERAVWLNM